MKNATIVASAVLGLFATVGCAADGDSETAEKSQDLVQCVGINECAGTSECASEGGNSCEGMNECKGMGWITTTRSMCEDENGMILES